MQLYHAFGGGIIAWRQASDPYVPSTIKRTLGYSVRTALGAARVHSTLSVAGSAITGASSGTFALTASGVATLLIAGSSNAAFTLTGSSVASLPISATSTGALGLSGSATGTVAQDGWGSAGVFTLGGSGEASFVVGAASAGAFSLAGSGAGAVSIAAASSGVVALGGSATGQIAQEGGGTADPAAVWNYTLTNGKTAQQTLVELHAMLADLYRIHGLAAGEPLVVDKFERTAGDIVQSITQVGDVVTVNRTS